MPLGPRRVAIALAALILAPAAHASGQGTVDGVELVWHWERADGTTDSRRADESLNPASVVKLATTLWALETLGPAHRFRTTFAIRGTIDAESGVLHGDVLVFGNGDPDFHVENAQLVARRLIDAGIRRVDGSLCVNGAFWIGWERGADGRIDDPQRRASLMAKRLADAWNPRTWTPETVRAMRNYRERSGSQAPDARIEVARTAVLDPGGGPSQALFEHLSNPLAVILKRLNDHSNNDIERLDYTLGDAAAMTRFYRERWRDPEPAVSFGTLSGLGVNRLSPRQVVRLLRELQDSAERHGLRLADLLPALGCGRNTLRNYPRLEAALPQGGLVAKTGTLVQTDGGVVALAGSVASEGGDIVFCLAAPHSGARMETARRALSRWLLDLAAGWSIAGSECGPSDLYSYTEAAVASVSPGLVGQGSSAGAGSPIP